MQGKYAPVQPQSPGLSERIWWGAGTDSTAVWTAQQGLNLMSSTLMLEDKGVPFDQQQAEQIRLYREEWVKAEHTRVPRVSVSRSVIPIIDADSARYFGRRAQEDSQDTPVLSTIPSHGLGAATLANRGPDCRRTRS